MLSSLKKYILFNETCLTNLNFVKGNQNIQRSVLEKPQLINKLLASHNFQVNEFRTRTQPHLSKTRLEILQAGVELGQVEFCFCQAPSLSLKT